MEMLNAKSVKRTRFIGYAFLLGAVIFPLAVSSYTAAFDAGRMLGQTLMAVALGIIVTAIIFRKSSDDTKAKVTLTIFTLAFLYSAFWSFSTFNEERNLEKAVTNYSTTVDKVSKEIVAPKSTNTPVAIEGNSQAALPSKNTNRSNREILAEILNKAAAMQQQQAQRLMALNQKFEKLSLDGVLTPEKLTSKQALEEARVLLKAFSALISERDALYNSFAKQGENLINSIEMQAGDRKVAMETLLGNWQKQKKALTDLSNAQRVTIDAIATILTLAEKNYGSLVAKDGNILFTTQEQLNTYQSNIARISAAAQNEKNATAEYLNVLQERQLVIDKQLKEIRR